MTVLDDEPRVRELAQSPPRKEARDVGVASLEGLLERGVGDLGYYHRFGFAPALPHGIFMPAERQERLLVRALTPGALDGVGGEVQPWRSVRGAARLRPKPEIRAA